MHSVDHSKIYVVIQHDNGECSCAVECSEELCNSWRNTCSKAMASCLKWPTRILFALPHYGAGYLNFLYLKREVKNLIFTMPGRTECALCMAAADANIRRSVSCLNFSLKKIPGE